MVGRKGGLSGKQKSALLKDKRAKDRDPTGGGGSRRGGSNSGQANRKHSEDSDDDSSATAGMRFSQQVSRKGEVNSLSTRFVREDNEVVQARRLHGQVPFAPMADAPPIYREPPVCLGLPSRPPHQQRNAAAQESAERAAFDEWLTSIHGRFPHEALSPFEHNLEVWRQLWRCIERSDVVCLVADVRNPLLHIPAALYDHCVAKPGLRIVIVLSKVDLISPEELQSWKAYLSKRFPRATLADFSSKGRKVGGSTGGGVASRRKAINSPLTAEQRTAVRGYVEGIAQACGVTLPDAADSQPAATRGADDGGEAEGEACNEEASEEESESGDGAEESTAGVASVAELAQDEAQDEAAEAAAAPTSHGVTLGFIGHPNVGKTSLLNAIVGRKVASVSRTPGHTKHLQTWELTPDVTICDSPGLVFPIAGTLPAGVESCSEGADELSSNGPSTDADVASAAVAHPPGGGGGDAPTQQLQLDAAPRAVYECCGLFPIAQVREAYSAVRLLAGSIDLVRLYNLRDQDFEDPEDHSPLGFCMALADKRGYHLKGGKGVDPHRAGLEVLRDCVDGAVCLAFRPPPEEPQAVSVS